MLHFSHILIVGPEGIRLIMKSDRIIERRNDMGLLNFLHKKKHVSPEIKEYLNTMLANGKTIRQQREKDLQQAFGNYDKDVVTFRGMHIVANTVPAMKDYEKLNNYEKVFFEEFSKQLKKDNYKPEEVKLTRLSDGTFNVDYIPIAYVGKVNLYKKPVRYAVKRSTNKRPTKIYSTKKEADEFAKTNADYEVLILETEIKTYMQYMIGLSNIKEVQNEPLEVLIETIPRWIKYLNYCQRSK